ncbi:hypothetical protein GCM10027053_15910 [Intrasporangium mesophilum]
MDNLWSALESLATASAVALALVTFIFSNRRDKAIRRADLVRAYTSDFYADQNVVKLFSDLDYDRFRFDATDEWLGTGAESTLVRMLDIFNSLGHNARHGVIGLSDIHGTTIGYAVLRAYDSAEVVRYLEYVRQWDHEHLGTGVPFQFFQELAMELRTVSARTRRLNRLLPAVLEPREGSTVPGTKAESDP